MQSKACVKPVIPSSSGTTTHVLDDVRVHALPTLCERQRRLRLRSTQAEKEKGWLRKEEKWEREGEEGGDTCVLL